MVSFESPVKKCGLWLLVLVVYAGPAVAGEMVVKYWDGTAGRNDYEVALLQLALDKTADRYPPYTMTHYEADLGSLRGRREVARGKLINTYCAPIRPPGSPHEKQIISVPIPVLKGLLGYRTLIVRADRVEEFRAITSREELRRQTVGQGQNWPDVAVYEHNGFPVMDAGFYDNLFAMLHYRRFDYLALGVNEAAQEIRRHNSGRELFAAVPDKVIYYPLPVVYHFSASAPQLARRVEEGLRLAGQDGSMDALFKAHFGQELEMLRQPGLQVFVLENPWLEDRLGLEFPQLIEPGQPRPAVTGAATPTPPPTE